MAMGKKEAMCKMASFVFVWVLIIAALMSARVYQNYCANNAETEVTRVAIMMEKNGEVVRISSESEVRFTLVF